MYSLSWMGLYDHRDREGGQEGDGPHKRKFGGPGLPFQTSILNQLNN